MPIADDLPHRIVSLRGRPRLDGNAWVAGTFQLLRSRAATVMIVGALALAPSWWLAGHGCPIEVDPPGVACGLMTLTAALLGEGALVAVAMHTLAGRRAGVLGVLGRALGRLPAIAAALLLRALACAAIVILAALAAERAGEAASLVVVAGAAVAIGLWSAWSLAPAVALCEGASPIAALVQSASLTRDLRLTVLKSRLRLALLMVALAALAGAIEAPHARLLLGHVLEVLWFGLGALLTAVSYVHLRARARRQRLEEATAEVSALLGGVRR